MAAKNNLKPKAYAKNNVDKWKHLTGYELTSLNDYTKEQLRGIASRYGITNYTSFNKVSDLIHEIEKNAKYKQAKPTVESYKTIFEIIKEKTGNKAKNFDWYKNTLKSLSGQYREDQGKLLLHEKRDALDDLIYQDQNLLRRRVFVGHMYFFEYRAETQSLPYYDKYPLVYVLSIDNGSFYGANLHYINPKKRVKVVQKLLQGKIDVPKKIIHKYMNDRCKSFFLDLAKQEWETSILLPVEDFVLMKGGGKYPYDKELVWEEMEQYYNDRLTGERIVKGKDTKDIRRVK